MPPVESDSVDEALVPTDTAAAGSLVVASIDILERFDEWIQGHIILETQTRHLDLF